MLGTAGLEVSHCGTVTMIGNEFRSIGANTDDTIGGATAVRAWSTVPWSLTGRFNRFVSNNADVHVLLGLSQA